MNFKDIVANDNMSVFINPDEFGEPILFGASGFETQELMAVVDRDTTEGPLYQHADGTFASKITLFIREADLGYRPVENQLIKFAPAGEEVYPYIVSRVTSDVGILEIAIEASET
ncbi:hypothetical protein [Paenibacillus tyrfis]|uniref:Uncharacterized protein n=1 Tax=Paenibacillus tyrfis TaxID=1501230 RepID=A0A081NV37_9BACL|nr:hypothetical protein [Paenibacillus tyrfis]KEQ22310.1 hypothetical protein ET33_26430 [Paenibacillus tyrfis]